jgi:uncharacterized protein DUF992
MFKHLVALVLVALAAAFVSPAVAQQPPGTSVGTLTCKMAPSIGLIFGSRQRMACRFTPNGSNPPEAYVGVMGTIGLDVGITAGGIMAWGVIAPTAGPRRGALAGTYVGASGAIGVTPPSVASISDQFHESRDTLAGRRTPPVRNLSRPPS